MNTINIGLAFLEGLALIVSPCILPVLPLVLVGSVEGGRQRPYGIIIGFVVAFSAFAILARKVVALLGIDIEPIKDASLVLLALFGLVLLSEKLSYKFSSLMSGAANLGSRLSSKGGEGLLSGIFIGSLIGLVWTPCAGPILAAVLVQVIRQDTDLAGYLIIISFAIGASIPMLAISIFGRKLMQKLGFLTRHAEAIRRAFGVLILLSVIYIAAGVDALTLFKSSRSPSQTTNNQTTLVNGVDKPYATPEFKGLENWINSPPLTMQGLRGKVVLVDFWTYSCINCVRTLPILIEWDRKYRTQGLVIVGVHSPEFEFEKKLENVKSAVAQYGIHYPVAQDNHLDTWTSFDNHYWPAHYLVNKDGQVVYVHFGEGEYDVTENNIRYLLGLKSKAATTAAEPEFTVDQTPETYLGYDRSERFAGKTAAVPDTPQSFTFPPFIPENQWALSGKWKVESEKIISVEKGAALRLNFKASKVFLVLGVNSGKPVHLTIKLNGEPVGNYAGKDVSGGAVTIERNTLYELIDQKYPKNSLLEIQADAPGVEAYAFTFG